MELGQRVSIQGRQSEGTIRYLGQCAFDPSGSWVGVELDAPEGKNDGSVRDVSYFSCHPMHGIFVRPEKVRPASSAGLASYLSGTSTMNADAPARQSAVPRRPRSSVLDEQEREIERLVQAGAPRMGSSRPAFDRPLEDPITSSAIRRPISNGCSSDGGSLGTGASVHANAIGLDDMDGDALLARAIAMSEQDEERRMAEAFGDEDEQLQAAIRASQAEAIASSATDCTEFDSLHSVGRSGPDTWEEHPAGSSSSSPTDLVSHSSRQSGSHASRDVRASSRDGSGASVLSRGRAGSHLRSRGSGSSAVSGSRHRPLVIDSDDDVDNDGFNEAALATMEVEEALSHGRRSRRRAGGAAGVDLSAFSSSGGDTVGFGGGFGDYVDDDDDPMLAAALAISRGEAPPGMGADGEFNPSLSGGLLGNDASLAALSAAQAHAMSGLVEGAPGRLGRRRSFTGAWKGKLQCLSSEAMDHAALSDGDKVLLPPSTLQEIIARVGESGMPHPMLFKLTPFVPSESGGVPDGDRLGKGRHVGVLEFSAPEGVVIVPLWIMRALGVSDGDALSLVSAELPRGTFAKLQPLDDRFVSLCGHDAKGTLERHLTASRCTLSMGDSVLLNLSADEVAAAGFAEDFGHGAAQVELFVVELKPAASVCVIETELEVDFASSVINEEEQKARAAQLEAEALAKEEEERQLAAQTAAAAAAAAAEAAVAAAAAAKEQLAAERKATAESLPEEPPAGSADVTTVLARMPDGRRGRRFGKDTPLSLVRAWVASEASLDHSMSDFELVSNYPRFVATASNAHMTLEQAGLHPQATFFVKEAEAAVV